MSHHNILVLEGGGAKGPFEMGVLEVLEKKADRNILEFIDLVVATSVGSVIGSFICTGTKPMSVWSQIIMQELPVFFKRRGWFSLPKYDKNNYTELYERYCKKGMLLSELPIKLMVTSLDRCEPRVHFFKSWEEKDGQLKVTEAAIRSFSAPYFFGSTVDNTSRKVWMDGGMGTDNLPLIEAFIEALRQGWLNPSDTVNILAVGSGRSDTGLPFEKAKKPGIIAQTIDQMKAYINIREGGMARDLSTPEQMSNITAIAEKMPNLTFQGIDWVGMPKKLDKMDDVRAREIYYKKGLQEGEAIDITKFKLPF